MDLSYISKSNMEWSRQPPLMTVDHKRIEEIMSASEELRVLRGIAEGDDYACLFTASASEDARRIEKVLRELLPKKPDVCCEKCGEPIGNSSYQTLAHLLERIAPALEKLIELLSPKIEARNNDDAQANRH